jgi:uncharacterized protein with GYD domain
VKFVALVSYTNEAWKTIIEEGLDRESGIAKSLESVGGRLDSAYWMMSHYDGLVIFEVDSELTAMACSAAIDASGTFKHVEIARLFPTSEHKMIIDRAREMDFHHHKHPAAPRH